jgi:hypothetical protein
VRPRKSVSNWDPSILRLVRHARSVVPAKAVQAPMLQGERGSNPLKWDAW